MSFLTPLYILGALAIAAPIVFHLIRRTPKGEVPFSSLMFLSPTPPKLTRRSRLENWPLLLLRALALLLLALAFGRPFLRQAARLDAGEAADRRVVVLLDTSASMRRGDLWERARRLADEAIGETRPGDRLAVLAFDDATRPLLSFDESGTLDPSRRLAVARSRLDELRPTWRATDLGQALLDAVAAFEDEARGDDLAGEVPRRIVLVSDLQRGARLDAIGDVEWPADVRVELRTVSDPSGNAGLQRLATPTVPTADAEQDDAIRVRVSNEGGSPGERFRVGWAEGDERPTDVSVPPGESRVVRVARPGGGTGGALILEGDPSEFDNVVYIADAPVVPETLLFLGDDALDDPEALLYYVARAFEDLPGREVRVRAVRAGEALAIETEQAVPLVVVADDPGEEAVARLSRFARDGGTVLGVLASADHAGTIEAIGGLTLGDVEEARVDPDAMLGEIDFGHPLFAPMAGPQYNDFTNVRFWHYRRIDEESLGDGRVVARFEGGTPAVVEWPMGRGRLVVLASSWGPGDSQLARSSKFVPLMTSLLDRGAEDEFDAGGLTVGDRIPVPEGDGERVVRTPGGSDVVLSAGTDEFSGAEVPGVYAVEGPDGPRRFAVNLDPAEGRTDPLEVAALEQLGVRMAGREADEADEAEARRQLMNAELERRQKLWRWGVVAAIGILIVETWLAGRFARPRPARAEAVAS
ncbi:BatA domain-containing protein [Tautonia plasticadhaerens]|uniref:VWFA domain-containing protein n=1 Tax=Tautonia plasticadhaerens TaxID=2527974 RepID=A0A518GW09_9BACT|nr:BatA domain-containing protein [Tautonia plasticadhaerens]QDV32786.1 hypothetical protein ElP_06260 [Tautonia plasticadhaerens]